MNGLPYYKAYPRDFIEGTIGMSFELKGAYRLVLDLIYMQGGELPDDDRYISGLLGCTIRKWKALRSELVALGKVRVNGEFLSNERAVFELETLRKLGDKQSENRSRPNKNNKLQSPNSIHTEPEPEPEAATLSSVASARPQDDYDRLQSKLTEAAGEAGIQPHAAFGVGPIAELIAHGVDLDADVIPTIKSVVARARRPAGSWAYFVPAIREAYERRLSSGKALPRQTDEFAAGTMMRQGDRFVPTTDARWTQRLTAWRKGAEWSRAEWGPRPEEKGCSAPAHLLEAISHAA